jgi:hypothetical protein
MTPLNPIMSNSSLGKQQLIKLYSEILNLKEDARSNQVERVSVGILS